MRSFLTVGRPTFTVMIQAREKSRVTGLMEKGKNGGADAFGLQLEQLLPQYRTAEHLRDMISAAEGKPVYVTDYRTMLNTGMSDDELTAELIRAASCGAALIDIMGDMYAPTPLQLTTDHTAAKKQKALIQNLHDLGAEVLMSSHTACFCREETVLSMVRKQHSRGADICKVVTSADTRDELYENFRISERLARLPYPSLFLCNGRFCRRHRLFAPFLADGIFLCVAERDDLSTRSQPLLSDARLLWLKIQEGETDK